MPTVHKSAIVPRTCERMFALVEECERYPEFLPWCHDAVVSERTPEITLARLHIDYKGLKTSIATRNLKKAPNELTLDFVEGPFDHFHAQWRFSPLGESGCKVEFALEYRFASKAVEAIVGPVFGYIAQTLVESFVARAEALGSASGNP